jgi:hypothetical protein
LIHRRNIQQSSIFAQGLGATQEVINSLPIYYYRKKKNEVETPSDDTIANNVTIVIHESAQQPQPLEEIITKPTPTITIPKKMRFRLFFRKSHDKSEQPHHHIDESAHQTLDLDAIDANCSICLGDYDDLEQLRQLKCKHHFHVECIDKWLKLKADCPLCVTSIKEKNQEDAIGS